MSAIWHSDDYTPSFLKGAPSFSFHDVAEIVQPATKNYEIARAHLQKWERKFGAVWYQDNAKRAWDLWQLKKPWWL